MQPMRPRFQLELPFDRAELLRRMDARLACTGCPCQTTVSSRHVEVRIRPDLRHAWSPHLSLEVEDLPEGRVLLNGLYGPNPSIWTLFMAAYASLCFTALFAGFLAASQLTMGASPWALWIVGGALVALAVPYAGSLWGQRLASEQMSLLRCFLEESLGVAHQPVVSGLCPEGSALP